MVEKEEEKISLLIKDLSSLESYLRELFDFSPLPLIFISPLGVILEANYAFQKISGCQLSEVIGERVETFFKKEEIKELIQETFQKKAVEGREIEFLPKGKEKIICQAFCRAREDEEGNLVGLFLAIIDLTEIKKLEEEKAIALIRERALMRDTAKKSQELEKRVKELEETRAALMNILEDVEEERKKAEEEKNKTLAIIQNFADGLLVFDKEGKLSLMNPQAESFFQLKSPHLIGKSISDLANFPSLSSLAELLGPKIKSVFRKELKVREGLILEVTTVPIVSDEERVGTLVVLHDITREKEIEQMKTEFVSISAHQLRTPLSAIKWTLKMLLDGDLGPLTTEQREFIEKTYHSNERMINLINDLLNVARIEEGRYLYKLVLEDFLSIVEKVFNSFSEIAKRKNIDFQFEKPKEKLPKVKVDVEKITLAVENLIENAIRYTLPGGKVVVKLEKKAKEIEFSVKDTGVGIPKDQQKRVFSKFFRGANVLKLETEGSGLGLFITKNIIEAHGGKIWFESEEGKGTTFYFTIPISGENEN